MKASFITVLISFVLFKTIVAITVTNIWQTLKITNPSALSRPQDIRTAAVGWKIATADVLPHDIFFFLMPYVFRTKFDGNEILLKAEDTVYARCKVNDGSFNSDISYLKCSMTSSVDDKKNLTVAGEINFDFVFNAGGSSSGSDISSAKRFTSGNNQVRFNNIKAVVSFQPGPFFTDKKTDELLYYSRSTPQDLEQVIVLSGTCNEGITSGSIIFTTNNFIDCSQFKLKITNDLNDFYLPKSYKPVDVGSIRCSSDNKKLTTTFNNIPPGYRVLLEGFEKYPNNSIYVKHLYAENLKCGDGSSKVDGITKLIRVVDGFSSSDGNIEVSSSIDLLSSLEMTNTQEATSPCNECETIPVRETKTTLNTNTVTETVCTECTHETRDSSTSVNSSTSEASSINSSKISSEIMSKTSKLSKSSKTSCDNCVHSSILYNSVPPPNSYTSESYTELQSSMEKTTSCIESSLWTIQTQDETTKSINNTTETFSCHECSTSLASSPTVLPVAETTETAVNNTTTETLSCHDCASSSILSTSIPPAIGTTQLTSYKESDLPSEDVSCTECKYHTVGISSESVKFWSPESVLPSSDVNDSTISAESLHTDECYTCEIPPITDAEAITESIYCDEDCTTTFPTYVPEASSSDLPPEQSDILATSYTEPFTKTYSQPQSYIADTSITSPTIIATATFSPYSGGYSSSSKYTSSHAFSSYEAFSNSNRLSWTVLLFSILTLLI